VYSCLVAKYSLPYAQKVVFAKCKDGKVKEHDAAFADSEKILIHYLEAYFNGKANPAPLMSEWVEPLLAGSVEKLTQAFKGQENEMFNHTYDDYLKWLRRSSKEMQFDSAIDHWQQPAQNLFGELSSWYSKKSKSGADDGSL